MPELQWEKGYLYVWMIFIGIVLFEIFIFHNVGWIELKYVAISFYLSTTSFPSSLLPFLLIPSSLILSSPFSVNYI
jgi:uncharacterized integral membrane protein